MGQMLKEIMKVEMANRMKIERLENKINDLYSEEKLEKEDFIELMSLVKCITVSKSL